MIYENFELNTGNDSQGIRIVADENETVDLDKTKLYSDGNTLTNKPPPVPPNEETKKSYLWVVLIIICLLVIIIVFFILREKRGIIEENDNE